MKVPRLKGLIDRRILVNYRVDATVLEGLLPHPFRPKLVSGWGIAGICLIRLKHVRPAGLPPFVGVRSENAAHRVAVTWYDVHGKEQSGVFIPRRDTSSFLNALAGGRLFPGVHHRASFRVIENDESYYVSFHAQDDTTLSVEVEETETWPAESVFPDRAAASHFFECGSLGFSPNPDGVRFDGLELRTRRWEVRPLTAVSIRSSFFDSHDKFPPGSVTFDNALLMKHIPHEWHSRATLQAGSGVTGG